MRAPAFWQRPPGLLAALLAPAALLFRLGGVLRRLTAVPYRAAIPLICVGNAVAGGAGKTPTALALAGLLRGQGVRPVFVARGHGGDGRVRIVDPSVHTVREVGDEALLLAGVAPTVAGHNRLAAVRLAETLGDIIVMDDGMQNPHLAPHLTLLVVDGESGIGNGRVMPAGPLRESFAAACRRAQAIIRIGDGHVELPETSLPVLRAHMNVVLPDTLPRDDHYYAFAGIGRPEKFYAGARRAGLKLVATRDFPDHHPYTEAEAARLALQAKGLQARLLTTAKDAVRLPPSFSAEVIVLPAVLRFDEADGMRLLELVTGARASS